MKWSISVICILSLYAGYAAAIRCYECDSITNSTCGDTFKADGFQPKDDCTTCTKAKGRKDGIQLVERSCGTSILPDKCQSETLYGVDVDLCWCRKDLCNSAFSVSASFSIMFVLIFISILYL